MRSSCFSSPIQRELNVQFWQRNQFPRTFANFVTYFHDPVLHIGLILRSAKTNVHDKILNIIVSKVMKVQLHYAMISLSRFIYTSI